MENIFIALHLCIFLSDCDALAGWWICLTDWATEGRYLEHLSWAQNPSFVRPGGGSLGVRIRIIKKWFKVNYILGISCDCTWPKCKVRYGGRNTKIQNRVLALNLLHCISNKNKQHLPFLFPHSAPELNHFCSFTIAACRNARSCRLLNLFLKAIFNVCRKTFYHELVERSRSQNLDLEIVWVTPRRGFSSSTPLHSSVEVHY